ncbi:MAG: TraB/GumN family protein [Proteobacteria bacterium]|nr:TraB/GumN family protein [Pseudomonadota bacterium]
MKTGVNFISVLAMLLAFSLPAVAKDIGIDFKSVKVVTAAHYVDSSGKRFIYTYKQKLPNHVVEKVAASKLVYVEKSEKEFKAFSEMMKNDHSYFFAGGLNNFDRQFTPQQWAKVRAAVTEAGWRSSAAETMKPWFLFYAIEGLGCGQDNGGYQLSLDARIMRVAASNKIPTIGLETPQLVDAYYRAIPERDLVEMFKSLPIMFYNYPHGPAGKARLDLLASENTVLAMLFADYVDMQQTNPRGAALRKKFTDQKILGARNRAWMPALKQAFNAGGAFVAVGAAHLGGSYGLLPMLQESGYKITRISLELSGG